MIFSDEIIKSLDNEVKKRLSSYRYVHTLGVRDAALKIASYCYLGDMSEIVAAAMLHDISKELSAKEQLLIIEHAKIDLYRSDMLSEQIFHSFTAPTVIRRDFSQFATDNVISAVFNHTTGAPNMSLFDEIIFVADYIEEGRTYDPCVKVREFLYSAFKHSHTREECILYLHMATLQALEYTLVDLIQNKKIISERTVLTRNAFLAKEQSNER